MPLPLIIGGIAAVAGAAGVGSGIHGAVKMKEASDTVKAAQKRNEKNVARLEDCNKSTMEVMDALGNREMKILASFKRFSDAFERIQNRPEFKDIVKGDVTISAYTPQEIKDAAVGAGVLLGGLGGAALGTAGGFAAAGATTAAVMALGTASTGTAIASLSGVAATNATLAALGGGALAAGGGGMALGAAVLGGATLGAGLLIGGLIFNAVGGKISDKADEAYSQMLKNEKKIDTVCEYLERLKFVASEYDDVLQKVEAIYEPHLSKLEKTVANKIVINGICDYNKFADDEKKLLENTVLLVGLLYEMCKVQIVKKAKSEDELNEINEADASKMIEKSKSALEKVVA